MTVTNLPPSSRSWVFRNRIDAGEQLADFLVKKIPLILQQQRLPLAVGLLRGGYPVAWALARKMGLPLTGLMVQKIATSEQPEFALGAISDSGNSHQTEQTETVVWNEGVEFSISKQEQEHLAQIARKKLLLKKGLGGRIFSASEQALLHQHQEGDGARRLALLVDDGVATGASVHAAALCLHARGFTRVRLCVPVVSRAVYEKLHDRKIFEAIHAVLIADQLESVGEFYEEFPQVEWEELRSLKEQFTSGAPPSPLTSSRKKSSR